MGKKSSAPAQTSTVSSTPYLASDVNYAAGQAKNLYTGVTPNPVKQSQLDSLNQQIAALQAQGQGGVTGINPAMSSQYAGVIPTGTTTPSTGIDPNLQSLIAQRDALSAEAGSATPNLPQFYPGQTYTDYSPETLSALDMITNRANAGSGVMNAANQATQDTISGKYLNSNPYLDSVVNTALGDVTKNFNNNILPGLTSTYAKSGRFGGGLMQNGISDAVGATGREAMNAAGGIRYQNYGDERQRQLQASALAPTLAQADYYDANQLLGVGSAREALNTAKLQDSMDRFNFTENQPSNMLDQYISRINALNGNYATTTSTGPGSTANSPNKLLSGIGGGMSGLGLASSLGLGGGATGAALAGMGPVGWGIGAAGLLGGLFG